MCLLQHSHLSSICSGNRTTPVTSYPVTQLFLIFSLLSITTARYQQSMSTTSSNTQHPRISSALFLLVAFPCCQLVGTQHSSRFSQSFQSCLSLCLATGGKHRWHIRNLIHLLGVAIVAHLRTHYWCICKIMSIWNVRIHHDSTRMLALPKPGMSRF